MDVVTMNPCFVKVTLRNPIEGEAKVIYKNMSLISTIIPKEDGCDLWSDGKCTQVKDSVESLMKQM